MAGSVGLKSLGFRSHKVQDKDLKPEDIGHGGVAKIVAPFWVPWVLMAATWGPKEKDPNFNNLPHASKPVQ